MGKESIKFKKSSELKEKIDQIIDSLKLTHIDKRRIFCVISEGSKAKAYARVWGLSRIFQEAANLQPIYVIEIIAKHFDKLSKEEQIKVLIHELLHIPKTFSGALLSHRGRYHRIGKREVEGMYKLYTNLYCQNNI